MTRLCIEIHSQFSHFVCVQLDSCYFNSLSDPSPLGLTMVLTAAQIQSFFEDADQMAIPHATVIQLQSEGIDSPDDLRDFDKDSLKEVAENLRKPTDRIPNPDPNAAPGSTIPRPAYVFGAKSQKHLNEACDLVRFYETIGRAPCTHLCQHPV